MIQELFYYECEISDPSNVLNKDQTPGSRSQEILKPY
jgi:hypothetical protein